MRCLGRLALLLILVTCGAALPPLVTWKCVHYRPTPLGAFVRSGLGDVYRDTYAEHFSRDLPLIANTGANCVTLDAWDSGRSHTKFLTAAARNGLYVVPTFPLNSDKYPDLFSASAQQYVLGHFNDFVAPLAGWKSIIAMIRLGEGANRNISEGGYAPVTAFTQFLPRLAAVRDVVFGRSPKVPFLVSMRSAATGVSASLSQIWQVNSATVDYWGLDASLDWRALNLIPANNLSKLIVTLEMTNYDANNESSDELAQINGLKKQMSQLELYGATSVVGLSMFEWHDVNARKPERLGLMTDVYPNGVMDRRHSGITRQAFAQGRDCLKSRYAYNWISATYSGVGWFNAADHCYPLVRLFPLAFIIAALGLGVIGVLVYIVATCCLVRAQSKNAHVRYIPLAPDSRTDPYMVAIQSSLDSLLDAVISGSMSMSLDLLTANMLNNINLVQASLLKMVTNRRTKEAVEMRCETLRKMIATLKIYARLALAERPGDLEEDERLQAQAAEEVQRAQRDTKRVLAQMREELTELERLRDSDVRVEYGLSLRIMSSAPQPSDKTWRTVRVPSHDNRSSPKPQRRQSKTSLNV